MKKIAKSLFLSLTLLGAALPGFAQFIEAVSWEADYTPKEVQVGDEITFSFKAKVDPGFTIYSAFPPEDWPSLGTEFGLDEEPVGLELLGRLEEKGKAKTKYDSIFEATITYFEQEVTFYHKARVTATQGTLKGYLRYQVCDDSRCVPGTYEFAFDLKAKEKKKVAEVQPAAKVDAPQNGAATPSGSGQTTAETTTATEGLPAQDAGNGSDGVLEPVQFEKKLLPEGPWKAGDTLSLIFEASIEPGYYVYSAIPPKDPANIPTSFQLDPESRGVTLLGELTEAGERKQKYDEVFETDIQYFTGEVTFTQKLVLTEPDPAIVGYLDYQVCNESACIPAKEEVSYGHTASLASGQVLAKAKMSLWEIILKSFAWGLAALLTPCVFPMIPLTVSYFTKQSGTRAAGIRNALIYGLSIVFIYTVPVIILTAVMGPTVLQEIANDPWMNVFFFLLLFVFGLSFLGWFELTLPSSWSTALGQKGSQGGLLGIFFMAVTLAVVSFSCTGPIVSIALADVFNDGVFVGPILAMLAFSTALALPFVLLAIFPSMLNAIPRSGGWMNVVKVTLGFLEIAFALTYLSQADLIWHLGLLDREILLAAEIVIFAVLGLYLLGKIQLPHDSPVERLSVPRLMAAICSLWFALYLFPGLWGAPLKMLAGFLPKPNNDMGVLLIEGQIPAGGQATAQLSGEDICNYPGKLYAELNDETPRGFCAFYDLQQGLEYARKHNKPVFLDFTGHSCKNCRHVELNVWPDPVVKKYLTEDYVLVSLYTDDSTPLEKVEITPDGKKLRTVGDKWLKYQVDTYRSNTQPEYIILDYNNRQLLPSLGYTLDVETFRTYLEEGLRKFREGREK